MSKSLLVGVVAIGVIGVGAITFMQRGDQAVSPPPNPPVPVTGSPEGAVPPAGQPEPSPTPPVAPEPAPVAVAPAVQEFTVSGDNFAFSLKEIRVKKGDRVRILFKNLQGKHDWKLDEFGAATKVLSAGQEEAVEFTADTAGSFEYYCSVGAHRQMGMKGMLIVQ